MGIEISDTLLQDLIAENVKKHVDDWFSCHPTSIKLAMDRAVEKVVVQMTEKSDEAYHSKTAEKKIEEVSKELESKHFDELKDRICARITQDFAELLDERFYDKYY